VNVNVIQLTSGLVVEPIFQLNIKPTHIASCDTNYYMNKLVTAHVGYYSNITWP